jgi:hypothetical protein
MLKNFLLAGFFLSTVYFGLQAFEAQQKVACLESELCVARGATSSSSSDSAELGAGINKIKNQISKSENPDKTHGEQIGGEESPSLNNSESSGEPNGSTANEEPRKAEIPAEVIDWRLKSVEKFVDLSDSQRAQLRDLFSGENRDPLSQKLTLKDVLGEENYSIYQEARVQARSKIESENREKDILYRARIINLTPKEESILRDVTLKVDQDIEARKQADVTKPVSPYEGLARYLQYEKLRRELIAAELKSELPNDKYEAYLKVDADSAASEMGVWHGE